MLPSKLECQFSIVAFCIMPCLGQVMMSNNPHVYLVTPLFLKVMPVIGNNGKILHDCLQLFYCPRPHMFVQGQLVLYMILPNPFKTPTLMVGSFVFATFCLSHARWTCQRHLKTFTPSPTTYSSAIHG